MQPPQPKDKVTTFTFKINKFNKWAGIGICHLQTAQGFHYDMNENYSQKNHNVYITSTGGYRISNYQGYSVVEYIYYKKAVMKFMKNEILFQINYTGVNFTFGEYSIIHCQYDPKNNTLNLLHQNDGITYQMDIANNNLEMSPCVMLYGTAEIEQI